MIFISPSRQTVEFYHSPKVFASTKISLRKRLHQASMRGCRGAGELEILLFGNVILGIIMVINPWPREFAGNANVVSCGAEEIAPGSESKKKRILSLIFGFFRIVRYNKRKRCSHIIELFQLYTTGLHGEGERWKASCAD
jgi:hypothetical protein